MSLTLGATDRKLLSLLQADGKASLQELAAAAGLSSSPCWRRIKRMEEAGLIRGYVARLDPKLLGLNALAYVFVSLVDHHEDTMGQFARLVGQEERIVECASVTGSADYILKVAAKDPEDLERFLMGGILASGLVRESHTHFILRQTKTRSPWPLID
jgi:DNA-binding Lrp family transcriptional regulator